MKIRKLHNMPYAQACVREYRKADGDGFDADVLQSYNTDVLEIDYETCQITCPGLYRATTRKHISSFMREKGLYYTIARTCATDNCLYNFVSGEYIPV